MFNEAIAHIPQWADAGIRHAAKGTPYPLGLTLTTSPNPDPNPNPDPDY